jgi:hypothetical protein
VVLSRAKLIFMFVKFKMAASAPSVKELNVLKQRCGVLNGNHHAGSKKNLRPVMHWTITNVPNSS